MPAPKPNPLDHRQAAEAEAAPLLLATASSSDGAADAAVSTRRPSLQSNEPRPKPRRVDTAALTGVRGLAAMHVALGHMFSFSTLRLDLIGGAASESPRR